ncbi:hypothetical protein Gotur_013471 [Gossypium turneri]
MEKEGFHWKCDSWWVKDGPVTINDVDGVSLDVLLGLGELPLETWTFISFVAKCDGRVYLTLELGISNVSLIYKEEA